MELKDTVEMMGSINYKERFKAEYLQTKIRYEKLKAYNNKIEAAYRTRYTGPYENPSDLKPIEAPPHDCPIDLLRDQQETMGRYLHILELRAVIEGIEL
mgnify:CR=1 FL=1